MSKENQIITEEINTMRYVYDRDHLSILGIYKLILIASLLSVVLTLLPLPKQSQEQTPSDYNGQIKSLSTRIKVLESASSKSGDVSINSLRENVDMLSGQVEAVNQTILENPDKAITSRLIREEQKNLNMQIQELKAENQTTRQYLVTMIVAILSLPLLTGLIGNADIWYKRIKQKAPK